MIEEWSYSVDAVEQLWVKVKLVGITFAIAVLYRPPNQNVQQALQVVENSVSAILPQVSEVIMMGDTNLNLLELTTITESFLEMLDVFGLQQMVESPTRISGTTCSLLDIIAISNPDMVTGAVQHVDVHDVSDHQLIICSLNIKVSRLGIQIKTYRDFGEFSQQEFDADMRRLHWQEILYNNNIERKVEILTDNILRLFNKHAPWHVVRVTKPKSPWFTNVLKKMKIERNKLLTRYKRSKKYDDWVAYKRMRNFVTSAVNTAKKAYLCQVQATRNSKETWRALRNLNVCSAKAYLVPESLRRPDEINTYFLESVESLGCHAEPDAVQYYLDSRVAENIDLFGVGVVRLDDVRGAIRSQTSNAAGSDGISLQMLRLCGDYIVPYIAHIFNTCIMEKHFPNFWKSSVVRPLPKAISPSKLSDLRPISLLPVLSKIFEKIIYDRVVQFLSSSNLFPTFQSGFRRGHSATTALAAIMDDILRAADHGESSTLLLLDYSKAFDTIDHSLLCAKLHYYCFSDEAVELLWSYLVNRRQVVKMDDKISQPGVLNSGVPQGSILGPLLFMIYTMDLVESVNDNCLIHQFADDTQVYVNYNRDNAEQVFHRLNATLKNIQSYSARQSLKLNPSKSVAINFGHALAGLDLGAVLDGAPVQPSETVKSLGLVIDKDLRFTGHVKLIMRKAYTALKSLYRNRNILTRDVRRRLCETLVLSHVNYADVVFGPCLDVRSSSRLQKIQNSCVRFICGLRKRDHVSPQLVGLGWLNMFSRRKLHMAVFVHRVLATGCPLYLRQKLRHRVDVHGLNTRNIHLLEIPKHRKAIFERCFSCAAVSVYNSVPHAIQSRSVNDFKLIYKKFLLGNPT